MPESKAVTLRREVYSYNMPQTEEFGEIGFTSEDRKILITLEANQANMREMFTDFRQSLERRMERIESDRAFKQDVDRVHGEIRRDLAEKADRNELQGSLVIELQKQVKLLEERVTRGYGWIAGVGFAGAVAGAVIGFLVKMLVGK